jgi:hypothetical protein
MLFAEKKCRKLAMGLVAFSPEVDLARKRRALWKLVVKKRQGKRVSSSLIRRKARQLGISCPLSVTSTQAEQSRYSDDVMIRHFLCTVLLSKIATFYMCNKFGSREHPRE